MYGAIDGNVTTFAVVAGVVGVDRSASVIIVLNGVTMGGYDFGNQERSDATIRGTIYVDADRDGLRDAGERGMLGVTVTLSLASLAAWESTNSCSARRTVSMVSSSIPRSWRNSICCSPVARRREGLI